MRCRTAERLILAPAEPEATQGGPEPRAQPGQQGDVRKTRPVIGRGNGGCTEVVTRYRHARADTRAGLMRELVARPAPRQKHDDDDPSALRRCY